MLVGVAPDGPLVVDDIAPEFFVHEQGLHETVQVADAAWVLQPHVPRLTLQLILQAHVPLVRHPPILSLLQLPQLLNEIAQRLLVSVANNL